MADRSIEQQDKRTSATVEEPKGPAWREPRFPWYGYLLINATVWAVLILVFFATKLGWFSTVERGIDRPGTAGLLFIVAACFLLVSLYDYLFDRSSEKFGAEQRRDLPRSSQAQEPDDN